MSQVWFAPGIVFAVAAVVAALAVVFALAFLVVIPSAASEHAVSRFSFVLPRKYRRNQEGIG
ncbi:hypothetical protein [Granulicella mallensis]|uniref:hypothetical protein n=1 Tax=Granulicella mallensis TaxID=940614 RepID=UPI0012370CE9|nr:hypothetical protein [Granulicella mallensis]